MLVKCFSIDELVFNCCDEPCFWFCSMFRALFCSTCFLFITVLVNHGEILTCMNLQLRPRFMMRSIWNIALHVILFVILPKKRVWGFLGKGLKKILNFVGLTQFVYVLLGVCFMGMHVGSNCILKIAVMSKRTAILQLGFHCCFFCAVWNWPINVFLKWFVVCGWMFALISYRSKAIVRAK